MLPEIKHSSALKVDRPLPAAQALHHNPVRRALLLRRLDIHAVRLRALHHQRAVARGILDAHRPARAGRRLERDAKRPRPRVARVVHAERAQARREAGLGRREVAEAGLDDPRLATGTEQLDAGDEEGEGGGGPRGPAVGVRDARVVVVGRVVQVARRAVALDEGRVGHARVVEHEAPLQAHEGEGRAGVAGLHVRLQLEAADEGRDGVGGFRGGRAVGGPARGELLRDGGGLGRVEGQVGDDGPGVAVLWVERGGLVVAVQAGRGVPEEGVGCGLDLVGGRGPGGQGVGLVEGGGEDGDLADGVVEDGVGLDIVAAHAKAKPVVRGRDLWLKVSMFVL